MSVRLRLPTITMFIACVTVIAACRGWRGDTYVAPRLGSNAATYRFGVPGDDWEPAGSLDDVQVAWVNRSLPASIRIHSECQGHGDSKLPEFLDHLRLGWTHWEVLEQRREPLAGRESLWATVTAELDGVRFKHEFVLVKKNGCLFDFSYSARPQAFDGGTEDFHRVVRNFQFPIRS